VASNIPLDDRSATLVYDEMSLEVTSQLEASPSLSIWSGRRWMDDPPAAEMVTSTDPR
jgi:hypothetical protein